MWDRDAERAALGAAMGGPAHAWEVLDVAPPGDFYDPPHEQIATAIHRLAVRGAGTDAILVDDELRSMGSRLPHGEGYVFELTSAASSPTLGGHYARIVADLAARRRLDAAADRVKQIAGDGTTDPEEAIEEARGELDRIVSAKTQRVVRVGDEFGDMLAALAEKPRLVLTPWTAVNRLIGGFRPGCVYVVGARPGAGKTAMAMNAAVGLSRTGLVGFLSLEMSRIELMKRIAAQLGRIHMQALMNNALTEDDWDRARDADRMAAKLDLALSDDASMSPAQIRGWVRSLAHEGELAGLVVDYVQLIQSADPSKDRRLVVGEFSRAMKLIAKEFQIPVLVLSQLNRKSEERMDKKPALSDLRESGDLEQDADVVLLLSRDDRDDSRRGEVDVQIAKNRHGSTGEVSLAWLGHYSLMEDLGGGWEPGA
ncbi:DnaB-like helicase C-terminal domain-containing protein [Microbacterium resistens]|nr:DnaB-like helicase C-terminal domain-containing protein [Microbacterium resistens]